MVAFPIHPTTEIVTSTDNAGVFKSSESPLTEAVKLLVLRACLTLTDLPYQQSSGGKRGYERSPKQKGHTLPLDLPEVCGILSINASQIIICL